jgi:hypothetical protein
MATNVAPCYGRQYIRYAETLEAAVKTQAGAGGVEVGEFCAVSLASYEGANVIAPAGAFNTAPTTIVGINQAYISTAEASPHTARQATIATSGLLLVEHDGGAAPAIGSQLEVNAKGQATTTGTPVTKDGVIPTVREVVAIGGRTLVSVSFS